ncbi:MAG: hypothetical protein NT075_37245, partial [Chloroflexi bacterium]|nr:hypothetical protein [Chloroflexota bacterium]
GETGHLRVLRGEIELTSQGKTQMVKCEGFDGVQKELAAFATAILEGTPHRNSAQEALRDLAVVEAMLEAAENGQRVAVHQR